MSDELSNAAKLAIQKYLVAIFVGGFSIFSVGVYFAAIEPLKNLESRTEKSVDSARNRADKNQEELEKLFKDFVIERDNILAQSTVINKKIKDASQVIDELEAMLEESTQIRNTVRRLQAKLIVLVQGAGPDKETQAGLNLTSMQANIVRLSEEISLVNSKVERIVRSDVRGEETAPGEETPVDDEGPTKLDVPIELSSCDPLDLTEQQIELISIERRVERTETFANNDKLYYRNIFSVAIRRDNAPVAENLGECILNAIERVDYLLSEYWFDPARRRRNDRNTNFRFSIRVWGVTSVNAEVHLKGDKPILKKRGRFSVSDDGQATYF